MNRKQRRQMARLEPALATRKTSNPGDGAVAGLFAKALLHFQAGRLPEAMDLYRQTLVVNPRHSGSLHHLGLIALKIGHAEIAVDMIEQAIALHETNAVLHHDICFALIALDRHAEAAGHAQRAIALKPDYLNAYLLLGDSFLKLRELDQAVDAYKQSLALDPTHAEARNNLAEALLAQGRLDEAAQHFEGALRLKPDITTAYNNLALIFLLRNDIPHALNIVMQGLRIKETPLLKITFVTCLRLANSAPDSSALREYIVRAMSEPWGRPVYMARTCATLVKCDPRIKRIVDRAETAWPARLSYQKLFGPDGLKTAGGDPVLRALLHNCHNNDIALERFLTMARSAVLDAIIAAPAAGLADDMVLTFSCMLARQCFINEYVFACGEDELAKIAILRDRVTAALRSGDDIAALTLASIASYEPLYSLPGCEALLARKWPGEIVDLLVQQVREPLAERDLRSSIPRLTPVEDDVSLLVQNQYEESPYPRWVKCAPDEITQPLDARMRSDFPHARYVPTGCTDRLDMLVGGCGTGQQAIQMARRYTGARVLAVDLSLASLCYAKYRSDALGLDNIEYGQADILKLASLDRQFDVIACSGVLHHLAEPLEGWRVLLSILRPNGVMHVGLYSEFARASIVAARDFLAQRGYSATVNDIRRGRQDILALDETSPSKIDTRSPDFYSTSNCRDLLFHVQEHRFTLPQIKTFLADNGLELLGFEINPIALQQYRAQFPDDPACTDLDRWHEFEQKNPRTFANMYQFVVQKQA